MSQISENSNGEKKQIRLRRVGGPKLYNGTEGILKNAANSSGPKKVLRRVGGAGLVSKHKIIQENLKTLEINTQKKRIAQAIYYGEPGKSPLTRNSADDKEENKKPVHTRLGNRKQIRLRRVPVIISNNRIIKSKNRLKQNQGVRRSFSVQSRLQRIRQHQLLQLQGTNVLNQFPNKIRLQRNRPPTSQQLKPTNLTVQINNKNVRFDNTVQGDFSGRHCPLAELNPKLQAEIKLIQKNNANPQPVFIPCEPIHVTGIGCTPLPLHERFSMLT